MFAIHFPIVCQIWSFPKATRAFQFFTIQLAQRQKINWALEYCANKRKAKQKKCGTSEGKQQLGRVRSGFTSEGRLEQIQEICYSVLNLIEIIKCFSKSWWNYDIERHLSPRHSQIIGAHPIALHEYIGGVSGRQFKDSKCLCCWFPTIFSSIKAGNERIVNYGKRKVFSQLQLTVQATVDFVA